MNAYLLRRLEKELKKSKKAKSYINMLLKIKDEQVGYKKKRG